MARGECRLRLEAAVELLVAEGLCRPTGAVTKVMCVAALAEVILQVRHGVAARHILQRLHRPAVKFAREVSPTAV